MMTNPKLHRLQLMFSKATTDLKNYDVERHESFKQYEMQKALEEELEMQKMNDFEKKQFLEEKRQQLKKHNQHEKMPHPVSKIISRINLVELIEIFDK